MPIQYIKSCTFPYVGIKSPLCTHTSTRLFNQQNGYTYESGDGTVQALSIEWEQVQHTLQVVYKAYYVLYTVPTDFADSLEHALQVACTNELSG
jgi:hypothetical protein